MAVNNEVKSSLKRLSGWNAFYQAVAPEIVSRLGEDYEIYTISKIALKMWKQLGSERRKEWRDQAQKYREDFDTGLVELQKKCTKCDKSFSRQRDLKYHEKGCIKVTCNDCGKDFSHKEYLSSHVRKEHLQEFKCDKCGKAFHSKRNLSRHDATHTQAKETCSVCGSQISSGNLHRHMKLKHA